MSIPVAQCQIDRVARGEATPEEAERLISIMADNAYFGSCCILSLAGEQQSATMEQLAELSKKVSDLVERRHGTVSFRKWKKENDSGKKDPRLGSKLINCLHYLVEEDTAKGIWEDAWDACRKHYETCNPTESGVKSG